MPPVAQAVGVQVAADARGLRRQVPGQAALEVVAVAHHQSPDRVTLGERGRRGEAQLGALAPQGDGVLGEEALGGLVGGAGDVGHHLDGDVLAVLTDQADGAVGVLHVEAHQIGRLAEAEGLLEGVGGLQVALDHAEALVEQPREDVDHPADALAHLGQVLGGDLLGEAIEHLVDLLEGGRHLVRQREGRLGSRRLAGRSARGLGGGLGLAESRQQGRRLGGGDLALFEHGQDLHAFVVHAFISSSLAIASAALSSPRSREARISARLGCALGVTVGVLRPRASMALSRRLRTVG
ncbi:hypothetical protein D3C86_470070 [compost metagenome]